MQAISKTNQTLQEKEGRKYSTNTKYYNKSSPVVLGSAPDVGSRDGLVKKEDAR